MPGTFLLTKLFARHGNVGFEMPSDGKTTWLRAAALVLRPPTSESHGLVAGLAGAGLATAGPDALLWEGWRKVLIGILFSTFLGFLGGTSLMIGILWIGRRWHPGHVRRIFGRLQG